MLELTVLYAMAMQSFIMIGSYVGGDREHTNTLGSL